MAKFSIWSCSFEQFGSYLISIHRSIRAKNLTNITVRKKNVKFDFQLYFFAKINGKFEYNNSVRS